MRQRPRKVHPERLPKTPESPNADDNNAHFLEKFLKWAHCVTIACTIILAVVIALLAGYLFLARAFKPQLVDTLYNNLRVLESHKRSSPSRIEKAVEHGGRDTNSLSQVESPMGFKFTKSTTNSSEPHHGGTPASKQVPWMIESGSAYENRESLLNNENCRILNIFDDIGVLPAVVTGEEQPSHSDCIWDGNLPINALNPVKDEIVNEKVDHWKKLRRAKAKLSSYSVLIIGVDGLSRYRAKRELSSTLALLKANGLSEMKGYHAIGVKSLGSFLPLVTGWTYQDVLFRCKQLWDTNVNRCPFIWRQFYASEYLTILAGDIPEIISPVRTNESQYFDYVLDENVAAQLMKQALPPEKCQNVSRIEGIFNILHNIFASHPSTPKFTLLWLNETTIVNELSSFDKILNKFLLKLINSFDILENSVIFFATHTSYSDPISEGDIAEHRLPSLFVHLPTGLSKDIPNLRRNLIQNGDRLVTPFTVHETLTRIWYLHSGSSPLKHEDSDYSVFDVIPETLTCQTSEIPEHTCACNPISPSPLLQTDQRLMARMAKRALRHLNDVTRRNFQKSDNCSKLEYLISTKLRKYLVDDGDHSKLLQFKYILNFIVAPSHSKFQARFAHFPKGSRLILRPPVDVLNTRRESRFEGYCFNPSATIITQKT